MVERRRRPELSWRWLTIDEVAQDLGHSSSWVPPERLARLQEIAFSIIDSILERTEREAIDTWRDRYRELPEEDDGPEHRQ
jgi:hypothetical protein